MKTFGDQPVLKGISAVFKPGKVNMVIGASGSGKSVLMKSMVGVFSIDEGQILYDEQDFSKMNRSERRPILQEVGMLFQNSALFDSMNVESNVMFPLTMFGGMTVKERENRVNEVLARVGLEGSNSKFPGELSGGMMKRVGIARAIILNPKYLYCDEPNSGLDPKTAIVIDDLIKEITEEYQMTTIINSHDMNSVMEIGDHIIFIHKGIKQWEGDKQSIVRTDDEILNDFVFSSVFLKEFRKSLAAKSSQ
jgi:phospholipid/cholesterol/gamma-HCH transport system ATP-binding protein